MFSMVGTAIKLSPSSKDMWGDRDLFRKATIARRKNYVLVIKFEQEEPDEDVGGDRGYSRTVRDATMECKDILPNLFVVVGYERPKRDSEMDALLHSSVPFRSTASSPTDDRRRTYHREIDVSLVPILIVYCNDTRTTVQTNQDRSLAPYIWKTVGNVTSTISRVRI